MIFYVISENKENTKTEFTEIWSQWWTKRDFVFCSCEHEYKSYHSNFGGKLTEIFDEWLINPRPKTESSEVTLLLNAP